MAIVRKVIPYEILIRFSDGSSHQRSPIGSFEGAHYIERTVLIDDQTGKIIGVPQGEIQDKAVDLPRGKVIDYLGATFVDLEAQLRTTIAARDDLDKQLKATETKLEAALAETAADKAASASAAAAGQQN